MSCKLIYNATIVNEGERFKGYVVVNGDLIAEVGRGEVPPELTDRCVDTENAEGCYLFPGVIDEHVHFRDPGLTHKGDIATESRAAVAGGVTSYMDMPNTKPLATTIEAVDAKYAHAADCSMANFGFFIGATNDNMEQLLACDYTHVPGVKLFLGSSTGNMLVDHQEALRHIFSRVKAVIAVHAESEQMIAEARQQAIARYGENVPVEEHSRIRSRQACLQATATAVEMAREYGARLHVLHISTADELALFSSGNIENKRITAETCPHYLWFDTSCYAALGARIKCNPAIKEASDRAALRRAVADGVIDVVATDHAPHLLSEKQGTALTAASGMPMVQFSLPVMLEISRQGAFSIETVVERMCHAPARLFGIDRRGFIRPGYYADLVVVRPDDAYTVTDTLVESRCGWTPLDGTRLHNRVVSTYVNGHRVYSNGAFDDTIRGRALEFRNIVSQS